MADKCLNAHNKAIDYLLNNQNPSNPKNPDEFNVGTYYVENETDERLFAYSVAYKLTRDNKYKELCKSLLDTGVDSDNMVANCRTYAYIVLLDSLEYNSKEYVQVKERLKSDCDAICDGVSANVYAYPYLTYFLMYLRP